MDSILIYKMYGEADLLLRHFEKRASKGKGLDDALTVGHFLLRSGLLDLLKDNAAGSVVKVNAPKLAKRVTVLQEMIREQFKANPKKD